MIGKAPTGTGTADQMDWPEAAIDLPDDPQEAIAVIEALLADTAGLERRRIRNVAEAMRRHDTRHRLHRLLVEFDLPIPETLTTGLERLEYLTSRLSTGH